MKIFSTLLVIKEIQMKIKCHFSVYRLTAITKFFIKYTMDNRLENRILLSCTGSGRINWLDLHCVP